MKNWLVLLSLLWIFTPSPSALAAALGPESADMLKNSLASQGLSDLALDLNVRIPVAGTPNMPAVDLYGTVIRHGNQRLPTILVATPYRREFCILMYLPLLAHGYNLMGVDIRGTGSSEGSWVMLGPEDHLDIAHVIDDWIPQQTWSDGRVGMIGPSYMGEIQLLAAGQVKTDAQGNPLHLKALFPFVDLSDPYQDVMPGGNMSLEWVPPFILATEILGVLPSLLGLGSDTLFKPDLNDIAEATAIWQEHFRNFTIPFGWFLDPTNERKTDFFEVRSPMIYWPQKPSGGWNFPGYPWLKVGTIPKKLPVFSVGGWFDILTKGTLDNYQYGLAEHGPGDKALVVGPWYHLDGAIGLGINGFLTGEITARWFDWKIKGIKDPFMVTYPVVLYVDGAKRWRAEKAWPLPANRVEQKRYYLSKKPASAIPLDWFSQSNASNNYRLVDLPGFDDYNNKFWFISWARNNPVLAHDPGKLHGLISRSSSRWGMGIPALPAQASRLLLGADIDNYMYYEDERTDDVGVLTFTTEPLAQDIEISGPLRITFWANSDFSPAISASQVQKVRDQVKNLLNIDVTTFLDIMAAKSVQWVVDVNDVFPNGRARNISAGYLNASQRPYDPANKLNIDPAFLAKPFNPFYDHGSKYPDPIAPGQTYAYALDILPMENVFKAGHRIRVSISASDFPHLLPIVQPSQNTIVIDENHQAKLEFSTVKPSGEGVDWKWIPHVDAYLRTHTN